MELTLPSVKGYPRFLMPSGTILILHLTHEDLADLVGASRQKVTEHLNELERQQCLLREGRKLIVVPQRLQAVVGLSLVE